jgi:hypothetical protein
VRRRALPLRSCDGIRDIQQSLEDLVRIVLRVVAVGLLFAWPLAVQALTPLGSVRYSPDIAVVLGDVTVDHNEVAEDNLSGGVSVVNVGAIPPSAIITAYDRPPNGNQVLSFDTTVSLPGGVIAERGDVVRFDGATYTIELSAAATGVPSGAVVDAVSEIGPDDLLLSFDVAVEIHGVFADDEDLLRVHAGTASLFFDGSAAGIDPALDLDAAHLIATNGHLLLSFDGSGTVSGVSFAQSDVLEYAPATGSWEASYRGTSEHAGWAAAELHGLSVVVGNQPPPAPPSFNVIGGGGSAGSGLFVDSERVFGQGTPNAVPGDNCIAIYAAGPNGVPDQPPGSVDDELLGTGGTDASGNFVDAAENLGIPLSRPLMLGDALFAADACHGLVGQVAVVGAPATAPALSPAFLALAAALLALIGSLGVLRLRSSTRWPGSCRAAAG